jgi:hypothetical protein
MEAVIRNRRYWLRAAAIWPACLALGAEDAFWDSKDAAAWSDDEKQILLSQSPWARAGFMRLELEKNRRTPPAQGESSGTPNAGMPDTRPGVRSGGVRSVPIGGPKPPPVPSGGPDQPVQFRVLARWESAKPVRLAGGPETPDFDGGFYVIRLQGLPLMPPPKGKAGEDTPNPNESALLEIKESSRLERKGKPDVPCSRLFTGSGDVANQVLLYFPRGADPITASDRSVTLETRFTVSPVDPVPAERDDVQSRVGPLRGRG